MRIESAARPYRRVSALLVAFLVALCSPAQSGPHARPAANGEDGNLRVFALLTTDKDYWEKWDTPPDNIPKFVTPGKLSPHEQTRLLILIAGLEAKDGKIDAMCWANARVISRKVYEEGPRKPCFPNNGASEMGQGYYMANYSLTLSAYGGTPYFMEVNVEVSDQNSGRRVQIRLSVEISET